MTLDTKFSSNNEEVGTQQVHVGMAHQAGLNMSQGPQIEIP